MTHSRFRMAQSCIIFINCLYLAKLNPVLRIGDNGQLVERWNDALEIAGSSPLYMYFSSNNVRLLAYVFTGGDPRLEWLKRYDSNRV